MSRLGGELGSERPREMSSAVVPSPSHGAAPRFPPPWLWGALQGGVLLSGQIGPAHLGQSWSCPHCGLALVDQVGQLASPAEPRADVDGRRSTQRWARAPAAADLCLRRWNPAQPCFSTSEHQTSRQTVTQSFLDRIRRLLG